MMNPLRPARLAALLVCLIAPGCGGDDTFEPDANVPTDDGATGGARDSGTIADSGIIADSATIADGGTLDDAAPADAELPSDGPPPAHALYGDTPFSIVLLPDTQFYVQSYPETFPAETRWIVDHKVDEKIAFVLHLGDVVETFSQQGEWDQADAAMKMLEAAQIPWALCAGNHDTNVMNRQAVLLNKNFPTTRFTPALQASFEPNKIENAFYFMPAGGRTWLILSLEFGPRDEVLAWADQVVKANADKPAILLTHAYTYLGHARYDHNDTKQFWNPHTYAMPGTTNDGQEMFDKLVSRNDNILFVFSGHATWPQGATGLLSTRRANGYFLHEMLANYQGCPVDYMCVNPETKQPVKGGEGNIRILRVDPPNKIAHVETFSPVLMMSRPGGEHTFDLALE
jgi:hypothetical protein